MRGLASYERAVEQLFISAVLLTAAAPIFDCVNTPVSMHLSSAQLRGSIYTESGQATSRVSSQWSRAYTSVTITTLVHSNAYEWDEKA